MRFYLLLPWVMLVYLRKLERREEKKAGGIINRSIVKEREWEIDWDE